MTWVVLSVGIQSHSATCPCAFCDGIKGADGKAELRSKGGIM